MFTVSHRTASFLVNSAENIDECNALDASEEITQELSITTNYIEENYGKQGTALLSLVKNTEKRLDKLSGK